MRHTTGTGKSPGEKIVKDIKRATIARQLIRSINERGASSIPLKRRTASFWMVCVAKIALLSFAAGRGFPRAFTTSGRRTSWKLASGGWLAIQRVLQPPMRSKTWRREARDLKEVVAEQTPELRLLKKSMTGDGGDQE